MWGQPSPVTAARTSPWALLLETQAGNWGWRQQGTKHHPRGRQPQAQKHNTVETQPASLLWPLALGVSPAAPVPGSLGGQATVLGKYSDRLWTDPGITEHDT